MDSDTPELVAFFDEEQDYQFVKKIFMDKVVVPAIMSKCLVENCELDCKIITRVLNPPDHHRESDNGTVSSMSNESKLRIENNSIKDVKHEDDSKSIIVFSDDEVGKVSRRETELANFVVPWTDETADDDKSYSSEEATSESDEEENGSMNPTKSEEGFKHSQNYLRASGQSLVHQQQDQVACSGSNNVLLSNSGSAGSHSFAFPILPSDWNGSPARMVTERKEMSKPKKWSIRFLCCKI